MIGPRRPEQRRWALAGGIALAAHIAALALAIGHVAGTPPAPPEPVVLIELPPIGEPAEQDTPAPPPPAARQQPQPPMPAQHQPQPLPPAAPVIQHPLPKEALILPPPAPPQPAMSAPPATPAIQQAAPAPADSSSAAPPADPRARRQEADYFSQLSAHLNKRKTYPPEARAARQTGIVTVRFTVDRSGAVSAVSIKNSSGHAILDAATIALLQRVSPLPPFPAAMTRDRISLSLPIEYALRHD